MHVCCVIFNKVWVWVSVIASLGTKNYSIQKWGEVQFYFKMHRKLFGGRAPSRAAGGAYNIIIIIIITKELIKVMPSQLQTVTGTVT